MFSICSAMAFASKMPTQIGSTRCPSLSRRITIGMFVIGIDHQPLDRHLDLHDPLQPRRPAPLSTTGRVPRRCAARRARSRTGTVRPIQSAGPGRFTTTLLRRAARQLASRAAGSPRPPARRPSRPTSAVVQLALDLPLQRLQRHDPPRLLLLRHIVGQPLVGERVRPRRVLEREHAVIPRPPRSATACPRSRRRSRPGTRRSYRSRARRPAAPRGSARPDPDSSRACSGAASRASTRVDPDCTGRCRCRQIFGSRRHRLEEPRSSRAADAGSRTGSARCPSTSWTASSSPVKSHAGIVRRLRSG